MVKATHYPRKGKASLSSSLKRLSATAEKVARNSYSRYSGFKVGAALKLSNSKVVTGTNVESVSYGLTICAERAALVQAIAKYGPKIRVKAFAVANLNKTASTPCGACRQMLSEFTDPDAPVVFPAKDGTRVMPFRELLPLAFEMES